MITPSGFLHHLMKRRMVFFAGAGGVGKTTVAAASAVEAALRGRRVLALTIDPARRLAEALGLDAKGGEVCEVDLSACRPARRASLTTGRLWCLMLDPKRACDELVERLAPSPEVRDRVLENRFYQMASNSLAGTQEYVALGKLYDLLKRPDWDLIVVDTAPTEHAIDFMEAPMRLFNAFDSRVLSILKMPVNALHRLGGGMLQRGIEAVLERLERTIGLSFLADISSFVLAIEEITGGFRDRARVIHELLQDPGQTAFGIVCTPQSVSVEEALSLYRRLQLLGMHFEFFVANRVHPAVPDLGPAGDLELGGLGLDPDLAAALARSHRLQCGRHRADQVNLERLRRTTGGGGVKVVEVPFLPRDVYDLPGLLTLGAYLTGERAPAEWAKPLLSPS